MQSAKCRVIGIALAVVFCLAVGMSGYAATRSRSKPAPKPAPKPVVTRRAIEGGFALDFKTPIVWKKGSTAVSIKGIGLTGNPEFPETSTLVLFAEVTDPSTLFEVSQIDLKLGAGKTLEAQGQSSAGYDSPPTRKNVLELYFAPPPVGLKSIQELSGTLARFPVPEIDQYGPFSLQALANPVKLEVAKTYLVLANWSVDNMPVTYLGDYLVEGDPGQEAASAAARAAAAEGNKVYLTMRFHGTVLGGLETSLHATVIGADGQRLAMTERTHKSDKPITEAPGSYLGIRVGAMTDERKKSSGANAGAWVVAIDQNGPAPESKLAVGDVITKIGDTVVTGPQDVEKVSLKAGEAVPLTVMRSGQETQLSLVPAASPLWKAMFPRPTDLDGLLDKEKKPGQGQSYHLMCFSSIDAVPADFKPAKVEFKATVRGEATKIIPFKFTNIAVPAEMWK